MYDSTTLAERIAGIIVNGGQSVNAALTESGLSKDLISNMKKGSQVAVNRIAQLADYLHCSVDYLLGRTDVPEVNTASVDPLPEDEQTLLARYRRLDPDGKELVRARALECLRDIQQGDGTTAESAGRLA